MSLVFNGEVIVEDNFTIISNGECTMGPTTPGHEVELLFTPLKNAKNDTPHLVSLRGRDRDVISLDHDLVTPKLHLPTGHDAWDIRQSMKHQFLLP